MTDVSRQRCWWAVAALALFVAARANAESFPIPGKLDARIRAVYYEPDQVYRLSGFAGFELDLVFGTDEKFVGLSAGDPEALIYSAHGNVLTLRPKTASVHTNITVTTSLHRYYFEYSATDRRPQGADDVMYAVRFTYPPAPVKVRGPTGAEITNAELERAERSPPENVDYWYCGSPELKPMAASDNGIETRLTFGARSELPAIFVLNDDGSESLINFSIDQGDVIVQRIARRFILRRGKLIGCIVNEGFLGAGERLKSGTISPAVTRVVKSQHP
ncbi:MAG TPA: TrbG/VirB9 family P-type conjugative transfer protein [Steroidobacteraceae bacterium]